MWQDGGLQSPATKKVAAETETGGQMEIKPAMSFWKLGGGVEISAFPIKLATGAGGCQVGRLSTTWGGTALHFGCSISVVQLSVRSGSPSAEWP